MKIQKEIDLQHHTTFGVSAMANSFAPINSVEDFESCMAEKKSKEELLILGGGSNILFTQDYKGLVVKNEIKGIDVLQETEEHYWIKVGAGENWHEFVLHAIENNWAGIENLSLIPGCVGAAPMQNIGAYGAEIKQVLVSVEAYHIYDKEVHVLSAEDCKLGYRESVFKNEFRNHYLITHVVFKLSKNPNFNISYGAIKQELDQMNISDLTLKAVSDAVIHIRQSKLPDPNEIGNAGSFFKNPIVSKEVGENLKSKHENIPMYPAGEESVKLAAGWLIEQAGWKGKTFGNYGVHKKQALVLVNYGGAQGNSIYKLSQDILEDVESKFGITLEREVNII